ncbi:hypothetical protein Tco_1204800 [Tanacetum coccineum]
MIALLPACLALGQIDAAGMVWDGDVSCKCRARVEAQPCFVPSLLPPVSSLLGVGGTNTGEAKKPLLL